MRTMRSVLRQVLFWVVLLLSVALIALSFLPRVMGYTPCGVGDESMEPLLRRGDLVLTKPVAFADVRVGDLLTFYDAAAGRQFTRTVAEIWTDTQEFVTKSPQSDAPDGYTTPYMHTVGRVERTVRFAGYPSVWLHTTVGKVVFALLLIFWIAVELEARSSSKRREKHHA